MARARRKAAELPPALPPFTAETWPVDKLKPYDRNARVHGKEQMQQLRASFRKFGQVWPILVREDATIIAGHGRLEAAKAERFKEVQVIVATGWSDEQCRAFGLLDNRVPLNAEWDKDKLGFELAALAAEGLDLEELGFAPLELESLAAQAGTQGLTDPDAVPETPAVPTSTVGDLWVCGRHRVLCGDALSLDDIKRLTGGVSPEIANCDPPYGISVVKGGGIGGAKPFGKVQGVGRPGKALRGRVHGPAKNAIIQPGVYAPIIGDDSTDTAVACHQVLVALNVPTVVLWGGNYYADKMPASRCWLIWDKENTGSFADAELAWTNQDKVVRLLRHQWSGLIKASERGEKRVHPTQKPVALAEWVIETLAPNAKTALDLFLGGGWTLIACERKAITCFGMELAPPYVDVCINRWQNYTGLNATLEGDGRTFDEIAAERLARAA